MSHGVSAWARAWLKRARPLDDDTTDAVKWSEAKAKARAVDPRGDAERATDKAIAQARHEAYVRSCQLSKMRKAAGMTRAELAEAMGVT